MTSCDRPFSGTDNHSALVGRLSLPVLLGAGPRWAPGGFCTARGPRREAGRQGPGGAAAWRRLPPRGCPALGFWVLRGTARGARADMRGAWEPMRKGPAPVPCCRPPQHKEAEPTPKVQGDRLISGCPPRPVTEERGQETLTRKPTKTAFPRPDPTERETEGRGCPRAFHRGTNDGRRKNATCPVTGASPGWALGAGRALGCSPPSATCLRAAEVLPPSSS